MTSRICWNEEAPSEVDFWASERLVETHRVSFLNHSKKNGGSCLSMKPTHSGINDLVQN